MPQITGSAFVGTNVAQVSPVFVFPAGTATGAGAIYSSIARYDTVKNNFTASVTTTGTVTGGGATATLYLSHDGINFWAAATPQAIATTSTINLTASLMVASFACVGISAAWTGTATLQATVAAAL